jgi:RimJ/RimL family protein N-acetyltransferase
MEIRGKTVCLRAIERYDLPALQRWSNDPAIQDCLGGWHFPASLDDMETWLRRSHRDLSSKRFAIETPAEGLVGTASLLDINWKDRNAFHGMMLGQRQTHGKGYGTDTVMAVMRHAFEELALERLDGTIIEYNHPSIHLYCDKCGWSVEGRKKNAYWRRNRYWEALVVGITREEYLQVSAALEYWG